MVNTFVTYRKKIGNEYIPDYEKSAESLDVPRLRKQCVEAYQILNILRHLKKIAKLENKELFQPIENEWGESPEYIYSSFLKRVEWCKSIRKEYLVLDYRYAKIAGKIVKVPVKDLPIRVRGDYILSQKKEVEYQNKLFPREKVILPGDELFTLGFSQHAIVKMWIGYENSLKEYINAHIDVYCTKKKKNGEYCSISLSKYDLASKKIIHPWWITRYEGVILSHRAALLRKEYYRKEPLHYFNNPDFTSIDLAWKKSGYVWTASLENPTYILQMLSDSPPSPKEICAPVNEKAKKFFIDENTGFVKIFLVKKYFYASISIFLISIFNCRGLHSFHSPLSIFCSTVRDGRYTSLSCFKKI